jgi:hypothetical protein
MRIEIGIGFFVDANITIVIDQRVFSTQSFDWKHLKVPFIKDVIQEQV